MKVADDYLAPLIKDSPVYPLLKEILKKLWRAFA